jgi:phage-related protein
VEGWEETQKLFNVQLAKAKQTIEVVAIKIGTKLIPVITSAVAWIGRHKDAAMALAAVIGGVLALSVVAYAAKLTLSAGKVVVGFAKMGAGAVKGAANVVRGFRSAEVAASNASGLAGTVGGKLRSGLNAAASGARSAFDSVRLRGMYAMDGVRAAAGRMRSGISSALSNVRQMGASAWTGVRNGAAQAARSVGGFSRSVASATASAGRGAWAGLASGVRSVGAAMKTAALASANFAKSVAASAMAGMRAAAAWVAQKVALIASAVAEKAAAAAQWLLNAAMDANPLGLIVLAIAALVAGLIYAYNHFTWFRNIVNTTFHAIGAVVAWVVGFVKSHWQLLLVIITGPIGVAVLLVIKYWSKIKSAVGAAVSWVVGFVKSHWQLLVGLLTGPIGVAVALVVKYWGKISSAFSKAYHAVISVGASLVSWVAALPGRILGGLARLGAYLYNLGRSAFLRFLTANQIIAGRVMSYVRGIPGRIRSALGNLGGLLTSAGRALISGLVNGIKSMAGAAYDAAKGVVSRLSNLFPHSPAKEGPFSGRGWTLHSGHALMVGLAQGITAGAPGAVATMRGAAQATADAFAGTLGIASPSKVFRQLGIYVNEGLVDGLTGSTARVKAATRRIESLLTQTYNRVADLKGTKGVSNKWVKQHEATIKRLEAYAKREDAVMRRLAAKRDSVAKALKAAQARLAAVQKQWTDERNSVASGIMQGFSVVTDAPQEGFALSAQDVVNKMRDQLAKATQFAAQLQALKKKGLSADLISQIASAGVDQGGATAAALASATQGQISQINQMQASTTKAANTAGAAVADAMYGAGLKSAQGLVKGLQSQEKAIEAQMMKIAKAMQKAIKKALGIKSPSQVFRDLGVFIPQGLAQGITQGAGHAVTATRNLAASVTGAGTASMSGLALAGGGGAAPIIHHSVNVTVQGHVLTERKLRDLIEEQMLRKGARNAGTWVNYKR